MNQLSLSAPVLLVGFMAAGKSSVGRALSRRLGCGFLDLDTLVERRAGKTIAEIFAALGEPAFRRLEAQALAEVLTESGAGVIALGGGAYAESANRERIARSGGRVVCLEVSLEEAIRRIKAVDAVRPLAADRARLERLFAERQSIYRQAHLCLETTDRSVESVVEELAAWIAHLGPEKDGVEPGSGGVTRS
jgi:shikimate kinase